MDLNNNLFLLVNVGLTKNKSSILINNNEYAVIEDKKAHILYILLAKEDIDVHSLVNEYQDLGHRTGILGCSTAEMKVNNYY